MNKMILFKFFLWDMGFYKIEICYFDKIKEIQQLQYNLIVDNFNYEFKYYLKLGWVELIIEINEFVLIKKLNILSVEII